MAKYFYFTRHGQTVWNVENKICGATDIALTDLGHQQAAELGERILKEGIKIDEILYSPLMRAADTAKHISEVTGIPAREELRLKEQNFGNMNQLQEMVKNSKERNKILCAVMKAVNLCYSFARESIIFLMI